MSLIRGSEVIRVSGRLPVDVLRGVADYGHSLLLLSSMCPPLQGVPKGPPETCLLSLSTGLGFFTFINLFLPLTSLEEDTAVPIYE